MSLHLLNDPTEFNFGLPVSSGPDPIEEPGLGAYGCPLRFAPWWLNPDYVQQRFDVPGGALCAIGARSMFEVRGILLLADTLLAIRYP